MNLLASVLVTMAVAQASTPGSQRPEPKDHYYDVNSNFLGMGYDLVYLDPEDLAAPAFSQPNLTIPPVVFALERGEERGTAINGTSFIVPRGVQYYPGRPKSQLDSDYTEIRSGNSYRSQLESSLTLSGGFKGIVSVSGSASFKDLVERTRNSEERVWQVRGVVEGHRLRIRWEDRPDDLKLSPEFQRDVRSLGGSLKYSDFISRWGTHFASAITYGGTAYFRLTARKSFLEEHRLSEQDFKAAVKGAFGMVRASAAGRRDRTTETTKTEQSLFQQIRVVAYGGNGAVIENNVAAYNVWAETVRDNPTALRVALTQYDELLTRGFFPDIGDIADRQKHLKTAIRDYLHDHEVDAPEKGEFFESAVKAPSLRPGARVGLQSWRGDYLHRADNAKGTPIASWDAGGGSDWTVEDAGKGRVRLKSWKGDYLHRADNAKGTPIVSWDAGGGSDWTVEDAGDGKIRLKSWKGDYLHRADDAKGRPIVSWDAGGGSDWTVRDAERR